MGRGFGEREEERLKRHISHVPLLHFLTPRHAATDLWHSRAGHSIINHSDPLAPLKVSKRPDEQASVSAKPPLTKHTAGVTVRSFPLKPHFRGERKMQVACFIANEWCHHLFSNICLFLYRDRLSVSV